MVEPDTDLERADDVPPRTLAPDEHGLSRRKISEEALKVLQRLHRSGHQACLVGGSVRDLLLDRRPKDFDVATDATPSQVRRLFRNSRVIGRRFRLVHVFFRGVIVEVSTFRGEPEVDPDTDDEHLVTDDNIFGTPRQDAFRRDFTVNALFYRIADGKIVDYVGGIEDLDEGLIRVIGDPDVRFREDPVRMLRACEMAGRLGFAIEDEAQKSIRRHATDLAKASPARMIEELLSLLRCGAAAPSLQWVWEVGLAPVLLPELEDMLEAEHAGLGAFPKLMPLVDELTTGDDPSDSLLLSVLLVASFVVARQKREDKLERPLRRAEVRAVIESVVARLGDRFALSHVRAKRTVATLFVFSRLCEPPTGTPGAIRRVAEHGLFSDAVLLYRLLVRATGEGQENLDEWSRAARSAARAPRRARRPRRRS
ncbi:MAG: polynucleotide adenylyltransferase PcnB, partial [Thermoanaerobaculia bacterium]|nr:polynucleotide adenylyltransferase PcnB [Thermoanaerobaculia bacterium]